MDKGLFRPEVLQSQNRGLTGHICLVQPPPIRWLTILITLFVVVGVFFLATGQYSRKQQVNGVLQTLEGIMRLQVQSDGIVSRLLVRDGETVSAGAPLVEISSQRFGQQQDELSGTLLVQASKVLKHLNNEKQQVKTQQEFVLQQLDSEINSLTLQIRELSYQQEILLERMEINNEQLARLHTLSDSGFVSVLELNRQRDQLLSLKQEERAIHTKVLQLQQLLAGLQSQKISLPARHSQELLTLEQQIELQRSKLAELSYQQVSVLRAPKAGIVSSLQFKVGQQVNNGQLALSLLPEVSSLEAVLYLPTEKIGFVGLGQEARLRYHAYPYQRFGVFTGTVLEISDTVTLPTDFPELMLTGPSFRVRVGLPSQTVLAYQKSLPLKAGMTLEADLITEKRSLLQWLFDPVLSLRGKF